MRHRSRTTSRTLVVDYDRRTVKGSSPCPSTVYVNHSIWTYDIESPESISDIVGHRESENSCAHDYVSDTTPAPSFSLSQVTANGYTQNVTGVPKVHFTDSRSYGMGISVPDNEADIFAMYQSLLPTIKQEMSESIVNFAIDFKQIKRLVSKTGALYKLSLLLRDYNLTTGSKSARRTLVPFLKWLAHADLEFHFGVLPLIDDLKAMYKSLSSAQAQFNTIRSNAKKWRTKHARFNGPQVLLSEQTSPGNTFYVICSPAPIVQETCYDYRELRVIKDISCVKLRYRYTMPNIPTWLAKTAATLDVVGLNLNPKIAWDALRLSFLVDWFLDVGRYLGQLKQPMLQPKVEVYSCVHSRNLVYERTAERRYSSGGKIVTLKAQYGTYRRYPTVPPMKALQASMDLSWFKAHIAGSLVVALKPR